MARSKGQAAGTQASPTQKDFKAGPGREGPIDQRIREALEDDEVKEALKSLHGFQDRCPKDV